MGQPTFAPPPPPPPALGNSSFEPVEVTPQQPTGTFVGRKVEELRKELGQLQASLASHNGALQIIRNETVENSQRYHGTVAAVSARLQVGTTPGNPVLVQQWNEAQAQLDRINEDIAKLNRLANGVAADSTMSAYVLESTRAAYGLAGAIDEDHRQLNILEDEVNRTVVVIDRLLNELSEDIARQTNYLNSERSNLSTLSIAVKNGEFFGASLANRAFAAPSSVAAAPSRRQTTAAGKTGDRRPLVVIRFDRPDVDYEQALYTAVSRVLERRPNTMFNLVAVAASQGSAAREALNTNLARRNAERVLRSLTDMGLPAERVAMSATTSQAAQSNEVHIYLR
jgi:hypothetical protein